MTLAHVGRRDRDDDEDGAWAMTNNELEARVIELEMQLRVKEDELRDEKNINRRMSQAADDELADAKRAVADVESELEDLGDIHKATEGELEDLQMYIAEQHADDPPERYADWYKRLHPVAGSEPDLHVARLPIRIIA